MIRYYLLSLAVLAILAYNTAAHQWFDNIVSDESRLTYHFQNNRQLAPIDTNIVLVNTAHFPSDTIYRWIKRLSKVGAKVIDVDVIDEYATDFDNISAYLILPAFLNEQEEFEYAPSSLDISRHYGCVNVENYFRIETKIQSNTISLPSVSIQIVKAFDPSKLRGHDNLLINYKPNTSFIVLRDLDSYPDFYLESFVKNKIVILGYLGYGATTVPDILEFEDVHQTPIGRIFGSMIIANEVSTILGDRINEPRITTLKLISFVLLILTFFIPAIFSRKSYWPILLVSNLLLVSFIIALSVFSSYLLFEKSYFLSIELLTLSIFLGVQGGIIYKLSKWKTINRSF